MKRPLLLRIVPDQWKGAVYYRMYRKQPERFAPLFERSELTFAPGVQMLSLLPTDYISECIALMGFFELDFSRRVVDIARTGGRLVDVGANMGYFPMLWLAAHAGNSCVAFEPVPRNVDRIRANAAHNHFTDRLDLRPVAAGKEASTLPLDLGPDQQTGWGSLGVEDTTRCIQVEVVRLDEVITDEDPIELLKIDTEGADPLVLRGAEQLIKRHQIREIFFEHNRPGLQRLQISESDAQDFLQSHGYKVECLDDPDRRVSTWHATPS